MIGNRASSLDMINRTMHNIETTITRERDDILSLSRRIGRLNLRDASVAREMTPALEDVRLSAPQPSVAAVAAAALNAERSAQRLKRSLLSARKEPLFNTSASSAAYMDTSTNSVPSKGFEPMTPSAFTTEPQLAVPFSLPSESDNDFVPLAESQSPSLSYGSRRGAGKSKHLKPVALKKSPSPAPAAAKTPSAFDWGPMPSLNSAPRTTLAFDVRAKSSSLAGK
jgi:nucleoporin NUP159